VEITHLPQVGLDGLRGTADLPEDVEELLAVRRLEFVPVVEQGDMFVVVVLFLGLLAVQLHGALDVLVYDLTSRLTYTNPGNRRRIYLVHLSCNSLQRRSCLAVTLRILALELEGTLV